MRFQQVGSFLGALLLTLGASMLLPLLAGLFYREKCVVPFVFSILTAIVTGGILYYTCRTKNDNARQLRPAEGMAIVTLGWISVGFFGALPFYFSGEFGGFTNSCFESVSGFTTTGASILKDIESVSKGMLFWRSLIQWLGGMGIIVLSLAILPLIGVGGMQLYKAEVPSPVPDKLKPRIRETAMILWKVYALISAWEVVFLMICGMSLFDALCHAFTTMPTGGFSTDNTSVAGYNSLGIDLILTFFMLLAGINFTLHYQFLKGNRLSFFRDPECRFFLAGFAIFTLLVTWDVFGTVYSGIGESMRYAVFQISSILTTTGYATADYELWPPMSQIILFLCMFLGGCAGSTGGAMKILRILLCIKYCYKELFSLIHPHAVIHVKIGGKTVPDEVMHSVLGFLALYMLLYAASAVLLSAMGVDFVTSLGAVAASIGNIGPGFGGVGPTDNFQAIPMAGKWLLMLDMLLGRLEIFTVIILFVPAFWRR